MFSLVGGRVCGYPPFYGSGDAALSRAIIDASVTFSPEKANSLSPAGCRQFFSVTLSSSCGCCSASALTVV